MTLPPRRVLIVDDEEPARRLLQEYLKKNPAWVLVGEARNGLEAVELAQKLEPDLLLLDVQMPKLDGFEVLGLLDPHIAVIFTTAFDEHALRAFEVHAVDYLLKPFSTERFSQALSRAEKRLGQLRELPAPELAEVARPPGSYLERLVVRDGPQIHIISVTDIECVTSQDDYVEIFFSGTSLLHQITLQRLEKGLDPHVFVRVHRSHLIRLECLDRIEPYGARSKVALLKSGRQVPVSRSGDARLRAALLVGG